jgi:hypothetical protein
MQKLRDKGVTGHMLDTVSSMYERSQSAVRYRGRLSEVCG